MNSAERELLLQRRAVSVAAEEVKRDLQRIFGGSQTERANDAPAPPPIVEMPPAAPAGPPIALARPPRSSRHSSRDSSRAADDARLDALQESIRSIERAIARLEARFGPVADLTASDAASDAATDAAVSDVGTSEGTALGTALGTLDGNDGGVGNGRISRAPTPPVPTLSSRRALTSHLNRRPRAVRRATLESAKSVSAWGYERIRHFRQNERR